MRINESPQPAYVGARLLEWRFEAFGISPEIFPDFSDKEYVQGVQDKIKVVNRTVTDKLTSEQISDANACVQAIVEMQTLEDAIDAYEASEMLEDLKPEWNRLNSRKNLFNLLGLGIIFVVPFIACIYSLFLQSGISRIFENSNLSKLACLMPIGVSLISLLVGVFVFRKGSSSRFKELEKMRRDLRSKVPSKEANEIYISTFGHQDSSGLKTLLEFRNSLINRVMGQIEDYDRFLLISS